MDSESYRVGFEAALELCLAETSQAKTKEDAIEKMGEFLGLIKEDKMDRLKQMIWAIRT